MKINYSLLQESVEISEDINNKEKPSKEEIKYTFETFLKEFKSLVKNRKKRFKQYQDMNKLTEEEQKELGLVGKMYGVETEEERAERIEEYLTGEIKLEELLLINEIIRYVTTISLLSYSAVVIGPSAFLVIGLFSILFDIMVESMNRSWVESIFDKKIKEINEKIDNAETDVEKNNLIRFRDTIQNNKEKIKKRKNPYSFILDKVTKFID